MNKIDKKKLKLKERINELEEEVRISLTKKTSNSAEINIPEYQRKISALKDELRKL